jgi:hypothetical protein
VALAIFSVAAPAVATVAASADTERIIVMNARLIGRNTPAAAG